MPSILFVCRANKFRSPIAAACFEQTMTQRGDAPGTRASTSDHEWKVNSAGTWAIPGLHVPPESVRAASAIDIDLSSRLTQGIVPSLLETYDLILVMERGQKEALLVEFPYLQPRVQLLSEVVDGMPYDIPDIRATDQTPEEIAGEICELIRRGFSKICQLALSMPGIQS